MAGRESPVKEYHEKGKGKAGRLSISVSRGSSGGQKGQRGWGGGRGFQ